MQTDIRAVVFVFAWQLFSCAAFASEKAMKSLCKPDELPVFECILKRSILSLCYESRDANLPTGILHYRFGKPGRIELEYPPPAMGSGATFYFSSTGYAGGGESHVRFRIGETDYIIFERSIRKESSGERYPKFYAGVVTRLFNRITSSRRCSNDAYFYNTLYKAKLFQETFEEIP